MPYAVITWLKFSDGTEWPQYFPEADADLSMLATDSLQLAVRTTEDVYLQTKLKALLRTSGSEVDVKERSYSKRISCVVLLFTVKRHNMLHIFE
jgi:hypothetical protein